MATLNIINKSPFEKRSLEQCLSRISSGDALLLIEDATVVAASGTAYEDKLVTAGKDHSLYVLAPDLEARGFADSKLVDGFNSLDYKGFVALAAEYDRVHSWL
jgi:tRNA 2-thiouridine synthesizing protein B